MKYLVTAIFCSVFFFVGCATRAQVYCLNNYNNWVNCPKGYTPGSKIEYKTQNKTPQKQKVRK